MNNIDLTPFGFTPTETLAYGALLEFGPSSGYALAKKLNIARANAYQALNGLEKKAAALASDDRPQIYRPVRPEALFARLSNTEAKKLDTLERQIGASPAADGDALVPISGRRALVNIALRTAAKEGGGVECVSTVEILSAIGPAWRRRVADGLETHLWIVGPIGELPTEPAGVVDPARLVDTFTGDPFLLAGAETVIAAYITGDSVRGYWANDSTFNALVRTSIKALTATG